jgi:hypothetical protein
MALNWSGIAAAYQGYQDQQRRVDDDARRAKADQRQEQDNQFTEQARNQQRRDWERENQTRSEDDASRQELARQASQAATSPAVLPAVGGLPTAAPTGDGSTPANDPSTSTGTSAGTSAGTSPSPAASPASNSSKSGPNSTSISAALPASPGGIPAPHNFNNMLDQQRQFLNGKLARGTLSAQDYSTSVAALNKMQSEGIHDALTLMAQGRYEDGIAHYNQSGLMRGASIVKGEPGTTQINGQPVPTHFVTVQNADGSRSVMDVAKAQYQMLDMNNQLAHIDKTRQTEMMRQHYADSAQLGRDQLSQHAKDAAASRAIQNGHLSLAMQQFNASTAPGLIGAKEKALGRPLSPDEKATLLGIDTMAPAQRLQLQSVLKEQDQLAQAINQAQASGTWQETDKDGKSNPLLVRQAALTGQRRQLLQGAGQAAPLGSNPLGLTLPGTGPATAPTTAPATSAAAAPVAAPIIKSVGGIRPAPTATPAATPAGAIDVRNDPILLSLRKSISQLNPQDPANTQAMMAIGTAINQRIEQLQQSNGSMTQLITQ